MNLRRASGPKRSAAALGAVLLALSSCIAPPSERDASVLPAEELKFISVVNQGKSYAARGRAELAEDAFREAITLRPEMVNVYNDLGFALQAQRRFEEAEEVLRRGLALSPVNVVLRDNLVRLLYQKGQYKEALTEADVMLALFDSHPLEELKKISATLLDDKERVKIFRNKAIIHYALGQYDEAVCYSWLAHETAGNFIEAGRHSRLLLSLNLIQPAMQTLRDAVIVHRGNVPAKIMLDYAIVLYAAGDRNSTKAALSRLLAFEQVSRSDRRSGHLLKLLIALEEKNSRDKAIMVETLFEEDEDLCTQKLIDPDGYWPLVLLDDMKQLVDRLCNDKDESLVES